MMFPWRVLCCPVTAAQMATKSVLKSKSEVTTDQSSVKMMNNQKLALKAYTFRQSNFIETECQEFNVKMYVKLYHNVSLISLQHYTGQALGAEFASLILS